MTQPDATALVPLGPGDAFVFACHAQAPCFNQCCRDLNQFLTPYDILRLKNHLGLSSRDFLDQYTTGHTGPQTGLPVVTLRTEGAKNFVCPFVSPEGCTVYENRPGSCRTYPLVRLASRDRNTGKKTERYFVLTESHCQGFDSDKEWTANDWVRNQGLEPFNQFNDIFMELIGLKAAAGPGPLDLKSQQVFRLACYDLDRFKERLEQGTLAACEGMGEKVLSKVLADETQLLHLAIRWVAHVLFNAPLVLDPKG
ncbi:MAG: YkgJ family cysteine cluster protein [Desulfatibacillum sp.]|nr:YkgJ family cysteine cluster protein [Desulfatibacillum sp.]